MSKKNFTLTINVGGDTHVVELYNLYIAVFHKMSQPRQFYSKLEKSQLVGKHKDVLQSKKNGYKSIRQKKTSRGKLYQTNLILNQV